MKLIFYYYANQPHSTTAQHNNNYRAAQHSNVFMHTYMDTRSVIQGQRGFLQSGFG